MSSKVLIVEDSALQAKMYRSLLGNYRDCRLVFAANGIEALQKLDLEPDVGLILLDINMPKMNGLAFLETMAHNGQDIPVIVVSTEGKDDDIRRALERGAKAYIKKPWKPEQLRELIEKVATL